MKSKKFLFTSVATLALLSAGISVPTFAQETSTNTTSSSSTQPSQVKSSISVSLTETTTGNLIRVTGSVDSLPTSFINFSADIIDTNTGKIADYAGPVFLTLRNNQTSNHDDLYIGSLPDGTYKVVLHNEEAWQSTTTDGATYWFTGESATFQVKNGLYVAPGTTPSSSAETATSSSSTETVTSSSSTEATTSPSSTETATSTSSTETVTSSSTISASTETSSTTASSEESQTKIVTWATVAGTWKNARGQVITIGENGKISGTFGNGQLSEFTAMPDKTRGGFNANVRTSAVGHYGLAYMPVGAKASNLDASDKTKERILVGQSDNSGNLEDYFYRVQTSSTPTSSPDKTNGTATSTSTSGQTQTSTAAREQTQPNKSTDTTKASQSSQKQVVKPVKKNSEQLPNTGESTQIVYLVAGFILLTFTAIFTKVKALKK
ncbi:TPA: LPXTG cell wall anchor domain-containing protein [Streptococcus suis]|nr:LPXTG cell wall anchor domain-containing protein [Streptococcus suis]